MIDFRDEQFAADLFRSAHKMQLYSLADETANFIGRTKFNASVVFSWYNLFAQFGNAVGVNLFAKSKVCCVVH
jgi:hypothetical protein